MDQNGRPEHVDAGNTCRIGVGADGKHVLAERGLVPDEPHDEYEDDRIQNVPRDGNRRAGLGRKLNHRRGNDVLILLGQTGNRLAVVVVEHEENQNQAVGDQLRCQRDDERMQAELRNEEAIDHADDRADEHDAQNRQQNPAAGDLRKVREELSRDRAVLQKSARNCGGQADHTAAGKVGAGQDDTARDTERHRKRGRNEGENVDDRARG